MKTGPPFEYFLSDVTEPVEEESPLWKAALPLHLKPQPPKGPALDVTYGDYFEGIRQFIEKDDFRAIAAAVFQTRKETIRPTDMGAVFVHLEKHGPFYHPARIRIVTPGSVIQFVLNVAVSSAGRRIINREFRLLQRLNAEFPFPFLPDVYALGTAYIRRKCLEMTMFLGKWLEGYHEFHITEPFEKGTRTIGVWDPLEGKVALTPKQAGWIYRETAAILTCYYNPETFEQIFPWYHAAGDFVVRLENDGLNLRLISVRQYGPMVGDEDNDLRSMLEAMLVFLLSLTIRTRIDRLDGTGRPVWADSLAVRATLSGFFKGLLLKTATYPLMEPLSVFFRQYLPSLSESDLYDLAASVVDTYHPQSPETPIIRSGLKDHISCLYAAVKAL